MPDQWPGQVVQAPPAGEYPGEVAPIETIVTGGRLPRKGEDGYQNFIAAGWKTDPDGNLIDPKAPKPKSFVQGVGEGAIDVVNHGAAWMQAGLDQLGGAGEAINQWGAENLGTAPTLDAAKAEQQRRFAERPVQGSGAGRFAGGVAATLPMGAVRGGVMLQGALTGALMSDSDTVGGVATDAGIGAVAGKIGQKVAQGVGRLVAPIGQKIGDNVKLLLGEGITGLTPGQVARDGTNVVAKKLAAFEDRAAGLPIVGGMIQANREAAQDQLNRAVANRALKAIGEKLPDDVETGHKSVAYVGDRVRAIYNDVIPKVSGVVDQTFANRMQALQARAALPPEYAPQVKQLMLEVSRAFTQNPGANGSFSGKTLQEATDRLDKLATGWKTNQGDPYLRQVGELAGDMREQLLSLARRQNPAQAARLRQADKAWAMLVRLENAAKGAKGGVFSPGQLTTAVRTSDRTIRKRAVGRGEALLQDLSDAASQVMPSTTGSSGTSERLAQSTLTGWGAGAAQSVPYMLARRDLARSMNASPASKAVADLIRAGAPMAGQVTAGSASVVRGSLDK